MNYEQKYKEALERARYYHSKDYILINSAIDDIFPELKESEDEKIRKTLIHYVENWKTYNPNSPFDDYAVYTSDRDECDGILAWLEKQGEKTLNADDVIAWLNDQACQGWIEDVEVDKFVEKFKKDFEL